MPEANIDAAWEMVRDDFKEFESEWYAYAHSGICDTEGRWACQDALVSKMTGVPFRVSFSKLQGYEDHKPSANCAYTKREIGNNMARALTKLSKSFKKAYRKHGYATSRWGKEYMSVRTFVAAIW